MEAFYIAGVIASIVAFSFAVIYLRRLIHHLKKKKQITTGQISLEHKIYLNVCKMLEDKDNWHDSGYGSEFTYKPTGFGITIGENHVMIRHPTEHTLSKHFARELKNKFWAQRHYMKRVEKTAKQSFLCDFFDGKYIETMCLISLSYDEREEIITFMNDDCEGDTFLNEKGVMFFMDKGDAVAFKMKWNNLTE